MLRKYRFISG